MINIFEIIGDFIFRFFTPRDFRRESGSGIFMFHLARDLRWAMYFLMLIVVLSGGVFQLLFILLGTIAADLVLEFFPEIEKTIWYYVTQTIFIVLATIGIIFITIFAITSLSQQAFGF